MKFTVTVATQYEVEAESPLQARGFMERQLDEGAIDLDVRDCWVEKVEVAAPDVDGLRQVQFSFDGVGIFTGYTDDTRWNGWLNVQVTPDEHARIIKAWTADDEDPEETLAEFQAMTVNERGLFSYANGYTTTEEL